MPPKIRGTIFPRFFLAVCLFTGGWASLPVQSAQAAVTTVSSTADSGDGSLRQALADASAGDTIVFDSTLSGSTLYLASPLELSKDITIDASSLSTALTLSGDTNNNGTRSTQVMVVDSGVNAALIHLIITYGTATNGGGISNQGTLTLLDCTISDNASGGNGAGVYNEGTLKVMNSTITGNTASGYGGGFYNASDATLTILAGVIVENTGSNGGGVWNSGGMSIRDTTINWNSATVGAGIYDASAGDSSISNSAFRGNEGTYFGAGIYQAGYSMTVTNSTFYGNKLKGDTHVGGAAIDNFGSLTLINNTFSNNISNNWVAIVNESGATLNYANNILVYLEQLMNYGTIGTHSHNMVYACSNCQSDISYVTPDLGTFQDNGGLTYTQAIGSDSSATDAGDSTYCPTTDQRGAVRTASACDLGAYEYGAELTAPEAVTSAALMEPATVTLNASITPGNTTTRIYFEYGPTSDYGFTTPADDYLAAGSTAVDVSAVLKYLVYGTTYHYRVVAVNSVGTDYGDDITVTPGTATASTGSATDLTYPSATLNGVVNPNGYSAAVSFEYGATTSYGQSIAISGNPLSGTAAQNVQVVLSDLAPNTTYHYRLAAVTDYGTSYGEDATFVLDYGPAAQTDAATDTGGDSVTLNGTINPRNLSTSVKFEYGETTSYGQEITASQSPLNGSVDSPVSAGLTNLKPNTTYHFRVVATNSAGTVDGEDQTFTTDEWKLFIDMVNGG